MRSVSILLPIALLLVALVTAKGNQPQHEIDFNEDMFDEDMEVTGEQLDETSRVSNYFESDNGAQFNSRAASIARKARSLPLSGSGVIIINSGSNVKLEPTMTGTCGFTESRSFHSNNYPTANYTKGDGCTLQLSTCEPRFLKITSGYLNIPNEDRIYLVSPGKTTRRLMHKHEYYSAYHYSTFVDLNFNARKGGYGFNIDFEILNNDCQQLILLQPNATGKVTLENYPRFTVCQYWIESTDPNYGVEIEFTYFNVGRRNYCKDDRVIIDHNGDPKYRKSLKFCNAAGAPDIETSVGTKLYVLLNGIKSMRKAGFVFVYSTYLR